MNTQPKTLKSRAGILALLLGLTPMAHAGTAFTYQGQLTNENGAITGACDMTFNLYDAATAGNAVGTANAKNSVNVINGLFTVQLDFGDSAFDGTDRFLEAAVKCGSDTELTTIGRQPVKPVPYAIMAQHVPFSGIANMPSLANSEHSHNEIYYTKQEIDTELTDKADSITLESALVTKSDISHTHDASAITSGSLHESLFPTNIPSLTKVENIQADWINALHPWGDDEVANTLTIDGGTINNSVIGATTPAAGTFTNITVNDANPFILEGAIADDFQTTLAITEPTVDQTITLPNASGTVILESTTTCADNQVLKKSGDTWICANDDQLTFAGTGSATTVAHSDHHHNNVYANAASTNQTLATLNATIANKADVSHSHDDRYYTETEVDTKLSALSVSSDRNQKENFVIVAPLQVLDKVATMPIETWNYQTQPDSIRHIGPMAQDFHAAFGVGENDKSIAIVDASGVALAAIQGLYQLVQQQQSQLQQQQVAITILKAENLQLHTGLEAVKHQMEDLEKTLLLRVAGQ
jgi:hypothetical protein